MKPAYPKRNVLLDTLAGGRVLRWLFFLLVLADVTLFSLDLRLGALDARPAYAPSRIHAVLEAQGPAGRQLYRRVECADLAFIGLYTLFFLGLSTALDGNRLLALLPAVFDFGETAGLLYLLGNYPRQPASAVLIVSICTPLKWVALTSLLTSIITTYRRQKLAVRDEVSCPLPLR